MPPIAPRTKTAGPLRVYLRESAEPVQSAVLTLPLLCFYGLGVLLVPSARNGVDFVSEVLHVVFASFGPARGMAYLGFYGGLVALNLLLIWWLSRNSSFHPRWFLPLMGEAALYAVATGTIASSITTDLVGLLQATAAPLATVRGMGPVEGVIVSAGAGLHEELVFRLVGIGLVARLWLGRDWQRPSTRLLALVLASSILFSAAHHIVEPFQLVAFVFRIVAGLIFAALFLLRGFAVAAWTHALYDVWVIVVLGR